MSEVQESYEELAGIFGAVLKSIGEPVTLTEEDFKVDEDTPFIIVEPQDDETVIVFLGQN